MRPWPPSARPQAQLHRHPYPRIPVSAVPPATSLTVLPSLAIVTYAIRQTEYSPILPTNVFDWSVDRPLLFENCERLHFGRRMSTAFRPQIDGQTERFNTAMDPYLRSYLCYLQDDRNS